MDIKDLKKGLVVYHDRLGLLVVDKVLQDGRVSCDDGNIVTYPHLIDKVTKDFLDDRNVTQDDLDARGAFI